MFLAGGFYRLFGTILVLGSSVLTAGAVIADDYFPPPESMGGWRKNVEPDFVRSLGLDPDEVEAFGGYNLSIPNQSRIEDYDYPIGR